MRPIRSLAGAAVLLAGCVTMEPTVVDPDRYLGARTTPDTVYTAPAAEPALLPLLDVRFEPMERLMLVNVSDDPVYTGVELQTFAIAGGEAALALLWRVDGVVDVYMTPGFPMDDTRRRSLESLLNRITVQEAEFAYRLNVTEHGLDAGVRIRDRDGRDVRVEVVETTGTPVFGALIAPVGAAVQRPRYLPLVFLDEFALVRRRGTRIEVEIDGERRTPDTMTRLVKGPASYFSRYSTRVVIANWNERQEDRLIFVRI